MKFEAALHIAKQVMKARPELILCGSVALILAKKMDVRDVADLDFYCRKEDFNEEGLETYGGYGPSNYEGYKCYKISTDNMTGFYYNIFVHEVDNLLTLDVDGITLQHPSQILTWKQAWRRPKDIKDLGIEQKRSIENEWGVSF